MNAHSCLACAIFVVGRQTVLCEPRVKVAHRANSCLERHKSGGGRAVAVRMYAGNVVLLGGERGHDGRGSECGNYASVLDACRTDRAVRVDDRHCDLRVRRKSESLCPFGSDKSCRSADLVDLATELVKHADKALVNSREELRRRKSRAARVVVVVLDSRVSDASDVSAAQQSCQIVARVDEFVCRGVDLGRLHVGFVELRVGELARKYAARDLEHIAKISGDRLDARGVFVCAHMLPELYVGVGIVLEFFIKAERNFL